MSKWSLIAICTQVDVPVPEFVEEVVHVPVTMTHTRVWANGSGSLLLFSAPADKDGVQKPFCFEGTFLFVRAKPSFLEISFLGDPMLGLANSCPDDRNLFCQGCVPDLT